MMHLMLCSSLLILLVLQGCGGTAKDPFSREYFTVNGNEMPETKAGDRQQNSAKVSGLKSRNTIMEIPNYLPTGFHDFVSSDQGPTYSYDDTKSRAKVRASFDPPTPHWERTSEFYPSSSSSDHLNNEESLTSHKDYRLVKPYRWYSTSLRGDKFPVPEDRLPSANASNSGEKTVTTTVQDEKKSRKARYVKNTNDLYPQWAWSKNSLTNYRSPQDYYTLISALKNGVDRSDNLYMDDTSPEHSLSSLLDDPLPIVIAAILFPLSMILAACLPALIGTMMFGGSGGNNIPLVTTTATGNSSGKIFETNSSDYFSPIMDAIGSSSPRSGDDDGECLWKTFCRKVKSEGPDSLSLQKAISGVSAFIDDYWLQALGLQNLVESMKDGKCERIQCSALQIL